MSRRTREIGIRMALGAAPRRIRRPVIREILQILGIGLALGIPAALALSRLTESRLFGVKPFDACKALFSSSSLRYTDIGAAATLTPLVYKC